MVLDDIQSLQTGPIGGSADAPDAERGDPTILSWVLQLMSNSVSSM